MLCFLYRSVLKGKLVGRIWGETLENEQTSSKVIAINIRHLTFDIQIGMYDIESINDAYLNT